MITRTAWIFSQSFQNAQAGQREFQEYIKHLQANVYCCSKIVGGDHLRKTFCKHLEELPKHLEFHSQMDSQRKLGCALSAIEIPRYPIVQLIQNKLQNMMQSMLIISRRTRDPGKTSRQNMKIYWITFADSSTLTK